MTQSLHLHQVSYRYPKSETAALEKLEADFPAGSFTLIMGSAGAGKSTLLMTLNGVIPQLKQGTLTGSVSLDGADLADYRVQTITGYVGLVLQDPESQLLGRTVAEDVAFGPRNYLVPREEIRTRVAASLAQVQLWGLEDRPTLELSGGQLQRLAIAGVLALHPKVICLDEPASELDPEGRSALYATVDALRGDHHTTIIVSEHEPAAVIDHAERMLVLDRGRLGWQGAPADFFRDPALPAAFGIKPLPIASIGQSLAQAGLIDPAAVPLTVAALAELVGELADPRALRPPTPPQIPTQAGPIVLEARNLSHTYTAQRPGLSGVDLQVVQGEFVAIVGRNGAGKSTLIKHFNRVLDPSSGQVLVNGRDASSSQPWELAHQVGYLFQNPDHQIFNATVATEVGYGLRLAGLAAPEVAARVAEVLAAVGLTELSDEHPFSLSKGERQLVAVASVLALRPEILVVDEPTTGQDWAGVQALMTLIDQLHAAGTTIVLVTHDLDLVAQHAQRVVVLDAGRVLATGPTAQVLADRSGLAAAGLRPTAAVELCQLLWPAAPPLLNEPALAEHLVKELRGVRAAK